MPANHSSLPAGDTQRFVNVCTSWSGRNGVDGRECSCGAYAHPHSYN